MDDCTCDKCERRRRFDSSGATDAIDEAIAELEAVAKRHGAKVSDMMGEDVQPGTHLSLLLVASARISLALDMSVPSFIGSAASAWNSEANLAAERRSARQ